MASKKNISKISVIVVSIALLAGLFLDSLPQVFQTVVAQAQNSNESISDNQVINKIPAQDAKANPGTNTAYLYQQLLASLATPGTQGTSTNGGTKTLPGIPNSVAFPAGSQLVDFDFLHGLVIVRLGPQGGPIVPLPSTAEIRFGPDSKPIGVVCPVEFPCGQLVPKSAPTGVQIPQSTSSQPPSSSVQSKSQTPSTTGSASSVTGLGSSISPNLGIPGGTPDPDGGTHNAGTPPIGGTPDGGTHNAGTPPIGGTPDAGTPNLAQIPDAGIGNGQPASNNNCAPDSPLDHGLPPNNMITSDYGLTRVYRHDGSVETVPENYQQNPDTDADVRTHRGIDYSSRNPQGVPTNLDFTAGVSGTVDVVEGSAYNTITIRLDNGNIVQFLHSSEVYVQDGQTVTPDTLIGRTGSTGADSIHLHVQARDAGGNYIDPRHVLGGANTNCAGGTESQSEEASDDAGVPVAQSAPTQVTGSATEPQEQTESTIASTTDPNTRAAITGEGQIGPPYFPPVLSEPQPSLPPQPNIIGGLDLGNSVLTEKQLTELLGELETSMESDSGSNSGSNPDQGESETSMEPDSGSNSDSIPDQGTLIIDKGTVEETVEGSATDDGSQQENTQPEEQRSAP